MSITAKPEAPDDFSIRHIRALRGPNYWRLAPVIACDVRLGKLEHVSSTDMPWLGERLLKLMPTLSQHPCTKGHAGGFVERLDEGTYLPHILEHVALELQTLAGADVGFGRVVPSGDEGVWWVIVGYEDEEVGKLAIGRGTEVIRACLAKKPFDICGAVEAMKQVRDVVAMDPSTRAIFDEAARRGIPARRLNSSSLIQLGLGKYLRRVKATVTDFTSAIAVDLTRSTEETKRVLRNIGLPVPEEADAGVRNEGGSASQLHRVLVVNGKVAAVTELRDSESGRAPVDRTDEIHPDNVTACEMAAGIVGLDIAGIDILTPAISVPLRDNGAVITAVNAGPGLRMHLSPAEGEPRNVAAPVLDMLFPPGAPSTIPVIAVTGTNGKTTTTRLIAHLFRNTGKIVGFTTTDGVYLQNRMVRSGDMTGPFAANIVLSNPTVEVAVLETARGGILRAGLGYDEADVGIVLNVSADHLGLRGITTLEQLADVKSVVAAMVKRQGHAVLNADEPLVYAMREKTGGDIALFSLMDKGTNRDFDAHVAKNGIGARIEEDLFVILRGRLRIPVARVREVPLMLGGAARFQRANILAAILAAYVQGMRYDDIRAGLQSFAPSPSLTPGRLNLTRVNGVRVLVDYAHNPAAIEGLLEVVRHLPARRRIGVVTAPGDRRDEDIREVGRLAAELDQVIVKEDANLRGREPGVVSALVNEGLIEKGMPAERIEFVPGEIDAIEHALASAGGEDLITVLADNVAGVLEYLDGAKAEVSPRLPPRAIPPR